MANVRDLGIYSETPFLDRIQRGIAAVLAKLFTQPLALGIGDLIWMVCIVFIVSHELRIRSTRTGFRIFLMTVLFLALLTWGRILAKVLVPRLNRLLFGLPVFGALGGLQRRIFFTAIKCSHEKRFKFKSEDLELVERQAKLDRDVTEFALKSNYHEILKTAPTEEQQKFEENWAEIWKNKILGIRIQVGRNQFITFEDALSDDNVDYRIEPLRLLSVGNVIAPIMKMAQIPLAYLLFVYLDGKINLLTVIQMGFFLGLTLCLILFNYHAHQSAEISFLDAELVPGLPDPIRQQLKELSGKVLRPLKVTVTKRYLVLIQNYFSGILAMSILVNTVAGLILVAVTLAIARVAHFSAMGTILHWYRNFSIGLILIQLGLLASYHLMFLMLRSFKLILASVIVTVLTAFLPYAFIYLATGKVDFNEMKNTYLALGTSLVTGLTVVITSLVKKNMEGDEKSDEDEKSESAENKTKLAG